jgi:hypothetical protein
VPDDLDYEWLAWLVEHFDEWTLSDLSTAQDMVAPGGDGALRLELAPHVAT